MRDYLNKQLAGLNMEVFGPMFIIVMAIVGYMYIIEGASFVETLAVGIVGGLIIGTIYAFIVPEHKPSRRCF